jgi:regulator of cell morphogenesis and NO signaling
MTDISNKTISQIVTDHYQTARVFEKYRLDFCCKGKRRLVAACEEMNIPVEPILDDLYECLSTQEEQPLFVDMSLAELTAYIVRVHHTYVKFNAIPITNYLLKVAGKHGDRFPYMKEVYQLFVQLVNELHDHMVDEEVSVFPAIRSLEQGGTITTPATSPLERLKEEHDKAGYIMMKIRTLTNDYTPPAQACTTFILTLESLKAFEEDLHKHVHLENNILFPRTASLFSTLDSLQRTDRCTI